MSRIWRISVRRILFLVSLLFLAMPLGSIYFLRIYESALIRQTESELISQAAFVSALYASEIQQALKANHQAAALYGLPAPKKAQSSDLPINPVPARLDLARDPIDPPRPLALYTTDALDAVARTAANHMMPVLKNAQRITLSGIKVLDYRGLVVAGKEEQGLSFAHVQEFQQAKTGKPVSLLRRRRMPKINAPLSSTSRNATINVFVALPVFLKDRLIGVVWLNRTPPELWQALYSKKRELFYTTLGLVLLTLLISALTSFTITRPLRGLIHKTRLIAEGSPDGLIPLQHPVTVEMAELSTQVASMAQAIQYRTEYIQNFAAHVSHEFKTPLTAIQGGVELLQDNLQEMPLDQQKRFLNNIAEDTERLKRLVNQLLALAQADMSLTHHQSTPLAPILEAFQSNHQADGFSILLPETMPAVAVRLTANSLEAVLNHLAENSRQAGASRIVVSTTVLNSSVVLTLQDDGPGISAANQKEVFTPFFTTKRHQGGTGMGLSISQSLLERQGASITLEASDQCACFRLTLPQA